MFFCGQIDANFLVIFKKMEESEKKKWLEFARDILKLGRDIVNYTAEKLENNWKKFSWED